MNPLVNVINLFKDPDFQEKAKAWDEKCKRMNPEEESHRFEKYMEQLGDNF